MLVKSSSPMTWIGTPRSVMLGGCLIMRSALLHRLLQLSMLIWTAVSGVLAQQRVPLDAPAGQRFAEYFEHTWEHPTGTPLHCDVLHSAARLGFGQDYESEYAFTVRMAQVDPKASRDAMVGIRVTPIEPTSQRAYFFLNSKLPDTVRGVEVPAKLNAAAEGFLIYGTGSYRVDWLFLLQSGQSCRDSWTLRTGPPPELPGRLAAGEVASVDYKDWTGFAPTQGGPSRRATILLHAAPRGHVIDRVHIAPQEIATLMGGLRTILGSGRYDSARVVVFQFYRTRIVYETGSMDPTSFRRVADALESVDIGTIDVATLQRANTRDDFLASLLLSEARITPLSEDVYLLGFTRGFANLWDVNWPSHAKLPFRLSYLALTAEFQPVHDAISQCVHKAGGRVVTVYNPRQLGRAVKFVEGKKLR
jgi:hypothetical protein